MRASAAEDAERPGTERGGGVRMITLEHLVLGAGAIRTRPGPYPESWPKIVLFVVVIAALGGVVAIWNRSRTILLFASAFP